MVSVTLFAVDRCGGASVLLSATDWVRAAGGRCAVVVDGRRIRFEIDAPSGLDDLIADELISWYNECNRHQRMAAPAFLTPRPSAAPSFPLVPAGGRLAAGVAGQSG